jgi:CRP/FNR family transcriptional regulator, nitrogen fixation regulation protein
MQSTEMIERCFERGKIRSESFAPSLPMSASFKCYVRDEEIYGAHECVEFVYRVISGAVRVCAHDSDGRRLIEGFYMPGDLFGFEVQARHRFSAEAISECEIAVVRRSALERAASTDRDAAMALWMLTAEKLRQTNEHLLVLGKKRAADRVYAFLLELAERANSDVIHLPMSRSDIADYLGLTIETVSRSFSSFERAAVLALDGARHVILKRTSRSQRLAA